MSNPIPKKHREKFVAHMREKDTQDAVGYFFDWHLLDAAEEFMLKYKMKHGNPQGALDYYNKVKNATEL